MSASLRIIRIIHVIQWFEIGGGETLALQLTRDQVAAGHEVHVIALQARGPLKAAFEAAASAVYVVVRNKNSFEPRVYGRLLGYFRRHRPQVVHTHDPQSMIYAAGPARALRAGVVHTKHGIEVGVTRRRQRFLLRAAGRCVGALVAVSDDVAESTRQAREIPARRVHFVRNGVDLARFAEIRSERHAVRRELDIPLDARVVGTVGRVAPVKDHATLVRAMAPLLGPACHLVIVGDGEEMANLRTQVDALANGQFVHLLGARHDVPRLLASFDVFALSSVSEGLPLAVLEAFACRLPIGATAVGGVPDVVKEGETGLLAPASDPNALGHQLQRLITDPKLAQEIGERGYALVCERYSMAETARAYMKLYARVCE